MARRKRGIHKKISSIFDGVPLPKDDGTQQTPVLDRAVYAPPRPSAPFSQIAPALEHQEPPLSLPKAAPAKQPKAAATIIKTTGRKTVWQQITDKLFAHKPDVSTARQKTMAILVPVLFIIFVVVLIKVFGVPLRKPITGPREVEEGNARSVVSSNNKIDWQIPTLYPATLRDPMRMKVAPVETTEPEVETTTLIVKGIVYSEDEPSAVIGTQVVREGEKVLGATIVKINEDNVEFEMDGKRWTQKVEH